MKFVALQQQMFVQVTGRRMNLCTNDHLKLMVPQNEDRIQTPFVHHVKDPNSKEHMKVRCLLGQCSNSNVSLCDIATCFTVYV